ncbi:MAG: DTW domain-containing protein [Bdellovibrio sp.]|nr:DTW domain-containing protein [Bdellovibrio sp.]
MTKQEYLLRKQTLLTLPEMAGRTVCVKCLRPHSCCFCDSIVPFESQSSLRILMHPKEARKEKVGTGRLANLCCVQSKIIVGVNFSQNPEVQQILNDKQYFPILLYPGEGAHNLSHGPLPFHQLSYQRPLFFVIDGTWPCAKTMMRESEVLHPLPRVSFDNSKVSRFAIKQQPLSNCLFYD